MRRFQGLSFTNNPTSVCRCELRRVNASRCISYCATAWRTLHRRTKRGEEIAHPELGRIRKNSGKSACYVWVICLSRIIALQNFPIEDCISVAWRFGQIENFPTKPKVSVRLRIIASEIFAVVVCHMLNRHPWTSVFGKNVSLRFW